MWYLLILLPFIMYAIINLTWRRVRVEYEFSIAAGELTIAKIFDGRSRRVKLTLTIADMTLITPLNSSTRRQLEAPDITSVRDYSISADSESAWLTISPDRASGKKRAVIIETNAEMQRIMRLCNPSAFSAR